MNPEASAQTAIERRSPALVALFAGLGDDGRHSVLDLGPASDAHLRLLRRFARRIRFAGLVPDGPRSGAWGAAVESLPPNPGRPYDVVLAWDVLDRVDPVERAGVIDRLDELTAPDARLYAYVDASGGATRCPIRSTLLDLERVRQVAVGPPEAAHAPILPAPLEQLLRPFEIEHAYTLRIGLREYVARKASGPAQPPPTRSVATTG